MPNKLTIAIKKLSPEMRKIVSNMGWLFADRFLRMGMGLLVGAWVARYLKPDGFGLLSYVGAFVVLFGAISGLGLDQIVVRDMVRNPSGKNEIIGTTFVLRIFGGIVTLLVTTTTVFLVNPGEELTLWLAGIMAAGTIFNAFNAIEFWFQSQVDSKYTVVAKNTAFFLAASIRIVLIEIKAPLIAFAWATLAETILGAVGVAIAYQVKGQRIKEWRVSWLRAKILLKESWSLIISGIAIMVYVRIDQIMLGILMDHKAVGLYSVAVKLSDLWSFIAGAMVNSVTPSIVAAKDRSETIYYSKLQKLFNMMALITFAIAIPMSLFSKPLVILIYGQDYAPASEALSIYIWSGVFGFFGWAKTIWIITESRTTFALITTCCGAVMNVVMNFWLIPIYGGSGAAIATVVSFAFTDYVTCFIYPPARPLAWVMTKALTFNLFTFRKLW